MGRFHLIIAGNEETFKRDFIFTQAESYKDSLTLILEYLNEEKFSLCLNAADIIALPYRKIFDGASGSLTDGAYLGKMIVAPSHGSLAEAITTGHLGYTFEAENIHSLAETLSKAINSCKDFRPDEIYKAYQKNLSLELFMERYKNLFCEIIK